MTEPNAEKPEELIDFDQNPDQTAMDVPQMMGPLYREHDEPRDGFEPVPLWMAGVFGLLIFWAGWYFATHSGDYRADVYDAPVPRNTDAGFIPHTPEQLTEAGRQLYIQCAVCHKSSGEGIPGVHPPLKDTDWVVGKEAKPERLIRIVLFGVKGEMTVNGQKYTVPMSGYGGQWKDHQVAAVLTYIRQAWGHKGEPITAEDVAKVRAEESARKYIDSESFTVPELLKK
ncbi:c-type cytochrome [Zavarzinella formosa]|uniref:c-type cytochrome n=1 Tax=Zavarzinella formosa TaxID=360055 RepID=UPI0002DB6727|nr:cytochrome c [Zavarzinella formosa]